MGGGCPGGSKKSLTPQIRLVPTQGTTINQSVRPLIHKHGNEHCSKCHDLVILSLETHPADRTAQVYIKSKQRGSVLPCFQDIKNKIKQTTNSEKYLKYLPMENKFYIH